MAERRLAELESEARRRWPVIECIIVHRLGTVPPTESSVAIAVSTPHRADAFAAGQWLIDSLKADVPIWKREQWADGTTEWVHPGIDDRVRAADRWIAGLQLHGLTQSLACNTLCTDSPTSTLGRMHTSLRISVTDRCNIRCFYCMPNENVRFRPRDEILTFEEITRFVRVVSQMGVHRLRLTGGEPLVRADLPGS